MKNDVGDFRKVLDLCDQISNIKERLTHRTSTGTPAEASLVNEKTAGLDRLWGQVDAAFAHGALGELRSRFSLSREELLVTALLLSRRIRKGNKGLSGRRILSMLYESAYDMVRGMPVLATDGNLRSSGVVVASDSYRQDVFETNFRLSDEMFYVIIDEIAGRATLESASVAEKPFSTAHEHLTEMGRLTALYRKRAATLFPVEAQDFFTVDWDISPDEVEYRIETGWADIEGRLLLTPRYDEYPLVRLERKYALSREEIIIVVSLFFVELVSPAPYLVVGDLIKLVSRNEEDLMTKRALLLPGAALVKSRIVVLDEEHSVHRKLTTFDAFLADWVVERLAGTGRGGGAITTDVQIDIHEFLKGFSKDGPQE